jgi:hypothetical protein
MAKEEKLRGYYYSFAWKKSGFGHTIRFLAGQLGTEVPSPWGRKGTGTIFALKG